MRKRTTPTRKAVGALALSLLAIGGLLAVSADGTWFVVGVLALAAGLTAEAAYWLVIAAQGHRGRRT